MKPDGKILPICMTIAGSDSGGGAGIQNGLSRGGLNNNGQNLQMVNFNQQSG